MSATISPRLVPGEVTKVRRRTSDLSDRRASDLGLQTLRFKTAKGATMQLQVRQALEPCAGMAPEKIGLKRLKATSQHGESSDPGPRSRRSEVRA